MTYEEALDLAHEFIASEELNGVFHETSRDNRQDAARDRGKGWNKGKEPPKDYRPRSPERNGSRNDPGARSRFSPKGQEQRGPRDDKAVERPPGDFQPCPNHPPAAMTHATAGSRARQGTTRSLPPPGHAGERGGEVCNSREGRPQPRITRRRWSISTLSLDDLSLSPPAEPNTAVCATPGHHPVGQS